MRVDPAVPDDARAIAEVHVASWQVAYKDLLPAQFLASLSTAQREKMWSEALERGSPQLLVARDEARVAGFVAVGPSRDEGAKEDCAEIWAIYLSPDTWSQGVGGLLWQAALERTREAGFRTVTLWVIAGNERAIRFYRRAGFVPDPDSIKEFTLGGVQLREIRYVFNHDA